MTDCVLYKYGGNPPYEIRVTPETPKLAPKTFMDKGQVYESQTVKRFMSMIPRDRPVVVADVGAQVGLYTLPIRYFPKAQVTAFEPFPVTRDLLEKNIKLNDQTNAEVIPKAVSNKSGTAMLSVCERHNGLHTLGVSPLRFEGGSKLEVETTTLDDEFYNKGRPLHLLKVDTEGWELYVLQGGINTIRKDKPVIQLEWVTRNMKQCAVNPNELLELLKKLEYRMVTDTHGERVYVHQSQLK